MSSTQYVYVMKGLTKMIGQKTILKDVYLSFLPGAKIGIIGVNGAGKSTLMKIMAGYDKEFNGEAWAADGVKVGYLHQEPELDESKNVFENIKDGLKEKQAILSRFEEISMLLCDPDLTDDNMNKLIEEQGILQDQIEAANAWEIEREIEIAMTALCCPPKDKEVSNLSGGEKRRVALCRLLLENPDILLLDEPTNHLDAASVAWLENFLQKYKGTVILVTHDRYFLDNVVDWVLELDRGNCYPFKGNYSHWLVYKAKRLEQESKIEDDRKKQMEKEAEWANANPKARQAKGKARLNNFEELRNKPRIMQQGVVRIMIPHGPRLGSKVIEIKNISKAYGEKVLFQDLSFNIPPSAIIGVIGENGLGKTTLMRILTGEEQPDSGDVSWGESIKISSVGQFRSLTPGNNVWQEISEGQEDINMGPNGSGGNLIFKSRAYCSAFNFKGQDQQKIVDNLSGGERNRVFLAKTLKSGGNFLCLDEPTNDLDVDTLRALEDAIEEFAGCVFVISHDRWFLNRIATHIIAFEGEGQVVYIQGNYDDYEEDFKRRYGENSNNNKVKFKKFAI